MSPTPGALPRVIEQWVEEEGDGPSRFQPLHFSSSNGPLVPAYEFVQHPQASPTLILSRFLIPNIVRGIHGCYVCSKLYIQKPQLEL